MNSIPNSSYATQIGEVFKNYGLEVGSFDIRFRDSSGQNYTYTANESHSEAIDDQLKSLHEQVSRDIQNALASEEMTLTYLKLADEEPCIYDASDPEKGYAKKSLPDLPAR